MTTEDLQRECQHCRDRFSDNIKSIEARLIVLETTLWGRGGENGVRGSISSLQKKMDTLLRFFWVAASIPAIAVAIIAFLKFIGRV